MNKFLGVFFFFCTIQISFAKDLAINFNDLPASSNSKTSASDNHLFVITKSIQLYDKTRERHIPVVIYVGAQSKGRADIPVVIINHGYTIKNTEYSFLAKALAERGYFVVSIQHDLQTDPALAKTGNIFEQRKPLWDRGSANILFVMKEIGRTTPSVDLSKVTLIGHSNGGDIAMYFASKYPELVKNVISLDSLRMPFPREGLFPILSIRGNDTQADEGVLSPPEVQKQKDITIIPIEEAKHIDLCDRGSEAIRKHIKKLVFQFLNNDA